MAPEKAVATGHTDNMGSAPQPLRPFVARSRPFVERSWPVGAWILINPVDTRGAYDETDGTGRFRGIGVGHVPCASAEQSDGDRRRAARGARVCRGVLRGRYRQAGSGAPARYVQVWFLAEQRHVGVSGVADDVRAGAGVRESREGPKQPGARVGSQGGAGAR